MSKINKPAIALAVITISVALTFTGSFAYFMVASQSVYESSASTATINSNSPMATINQDKNSSLSPSAPSAPTSVQNQSQSSPTPLDDSSYPEGIEEWIPFGNIGMISPTNQTYNTNNLSINVIGVMIAVGNPYLSYSLDGGPRQPIAIELKKPEGLEVTMQRQISGSVTLPPLTNGTHVIVLFADLGFDSRKSKETVYFDVVAG